MVYSGFSRDTHAVARERVDDSWRVYGYDAGWKDPVVGLELGKTPLDQLDVLDAFYDTEVHIDNIFDWRETNTKPMGRSIASTRQPTSSG